MIFNQRTCGLVRVLAFLVSLAIPLEASGATTVLSLPQLLEEAQRANPNILAARKRWEAAQARIPQSQGLPPPRIGIKFEEIPRGTVRLNQATIIYSLIQSLPFPGKLSLKHQVAIKEAAQAGMVFKQAEWDVLSEVKTAYYDLFLLDREREIQQEQLGWIGQTTAAVQAKYATGLATQAELLRAQGEQLIASNALEVLGDRRQALEAHMNHLLNHPFHSPVGAPEPIPLAWIGFSPDELLLVAQAQQPELLAFKFSAERADASWRLAKRELLPDLETMVELRDPAMGPFGPWDLTLALVLPFWFWTKLKYGVRVALHDKESAQAAFQAIQNEVAKRIHEHWHEARAAYRTAQLAQTGLIPLRRQAVTSALATYQNGRGSFMELLDALRALGDEQRSYYQELVALEGHIVMLEQASSLPLREAHALGAGAAS